MFTRGAGHGCRDSDFSLLLGPAAGCHSPPRQVITPGLSADCGRIQRRRLFGTWWARLGALWALQGSALGGCSSGGDAGSLLWLQCAVCCGSQLQLQDADPIATISRQFGPPLNKSHQTRHVRHVQAQIPPKVAPNPRQIDP